MEEIDELLAFDPSQLSVFSPREKKNSGFSNPNVYHPRCTEAKSKDHIYRATIKPVYNPFDFKNSVLERQTYYITDENGGQEVVSSLTNNDTNCPIFKAWKKCRYSEPGSVLWKQQAAEKDGGRALFDKRFGRWILIQVLADDNHPELVGKYMFWKCPKAVWETIDSKMHPSVESKKASIPVMDPLFGKAIELEVTPGPGNPGDERYNRETSYSTSELSEDPVSCTNPDGSSLLTDEQEKVLDAYVSDLKKIWKEKDPEQRASMTAELNAKENTKVLKAFYKDVLNKLKEFAPNLVEEMGYVAWDEATAARVQTWIDTVLAGNVPDKPAPKAVVMQQQTPADVVGAVKSLNTEATENTSPAFNVVEEEKDDDLPF